MPARSGRIRCACCRGGTSSSPWSPRPWAWRLHWAEARRSPRQPKEPMQESPRALCDRVSNDFPGGASARHDDSGHRRRLSQTRRKHRVAAWLTRSHAPSPRAARHQRAAGDRNLNGAVCSCFDARQRENFDPIHAAGVRRLERAVGPVMDDVIRRSVEISLHVSRERRQHRERVGDLEHSGGRVRDLLHGRVERERLRPGVSLLRAAAVVAVHRLQRVGSRLQQPQQRGDDGGLLRQLQASDAEGGRIRPDRDRARRAGPVGLPRAAGRRRRRVDADRQRQELGLHRCVGDPEYRAGIRVGAAAHPRPLRTQRLARHPCVALGERL